MTLDSLTAHIELKQHKEEIKNLHMRDLFNQDDNRFARFKIQGPGFLLDYSKNRVTDKSLELLIKAAKEAGLDKRITQLMSGEKINLTEGRPALHTALRSPNLDQKFVIDGIDIHQEIRLCRDKMTNLVSDIHNKTFLGYTGKAISTLVSIGIGGSFLGPKMVTEALKPYFIPGLDCHYVANIDGSDIIEALKVIDPETTLFLIQSKSFGTLETIHNASAVKKWLLEKGLNNEQISKQIIAVTSNNEAAIKFGVSENNILPMWDWVGGRYSLWSAIGFPIAFLLGMKNFESLLHGAHEMDNHFSSRDFKHNIPVIMGLLGIWYQNYFDAGSYAILPYDHYLQYLPDHLQQLDMESNGKRVNQHGIELNYQSGPIIWGGVGCNGQHAYHQLLHQGTRLIPSDFIIPIHSHNELGEHHKHLFANCLSQSQALMQGKSYQEALDDLLQSGMDVSEAEELAKHKVINGNQPSNTLLLDKLTPKSLGSLIASYEHKVFVQSVLWDINPFDQWGVELGKSLGDHIYDAMEKPELINSLDKSTAGLLDIFNHNRE